MLQIFLKTFCAVCIAEMGDKTQFLVMGLASHYRLRQIIAGILLAGAALNGISVALGSVLSGLLPMDYIQLASGLFFLAFAILSLSHAHETQDGQRSRGRLPGTLAVFCAFFLAELGDKTQLSAIAFSAGEPEFRLMVFFGATFGLVAADIIGLLFGAALQRRLPDSAFQLLSFGIFSVFGFAAAFPVLWSLLSPLWSVVWSVLISLGYLAALFFSWRKSRVICS